MSEGISVVYQNTDGLTCICKKHQEQRVYDLCENITRIFPKIKWEYEKFSKMVVRDVNNFLNITESGYVKKKGLFVTDPVLGNSCNFLVIPKALEQYYVNNIQPEEFIPHYDDIHDFCASKKVAKKFSVYWNNNKQQRLNRFYASKKGSYLYKKLGDKQHHMMKESAVQLLNTTDDSIPKDIDYQWYIKKVREVISDLEPNQLLLW